MQDVPLPASAAPEHDSTAGEALQRVAYVGELVDLGRVRHDARAREGRVRVQRAEEGCRASEVVDHFDPSAVLATVACRREGVDASAVLVVLVAPETRIRAALLRENIPPLG